MSVSKRFPSSEKAILVTVLEAWSFHFSSPVAASHSLIVSSHDPDATVLPFSEKVTALTEPSCPSSFCLSSPVAASHSLTVLSYDPDATVLPSGEKATALI